VQPPGGASFGGPVAFALVEVDKILDLPAPKYGELQRVMLFLERASAPGKPMGKPVTVDVEPQGAKSELRQAVNVGGRLVAPVTAQDLASGAAQLRAVAFYESRDGPPIPIGVTETMPVDFHPHAQEYIKLQSTDGLRPVGAMLAQHRLCHENDLPQHRQTMSQKPVSPRRHHTETRPDLSPRSGKFKRGSAEELQEAAGVAIDAQTRAIHQRINLAQTYDQKIPYDPNTSRVKEWVQPNGYRDWGDMDSLFSTMGPNPVANSSEMGANVCRVYEENTTIMRELRGHERKEIERGRKPQKQLVDEMLVETIYPGNPNQVQKGLRPVISKNVETIDHTALGGGVRELPTLRVKVHSAKNVQSTSAPRVVIEIPGKRSSRWQTTAAVSDRSNTTWGNEETVIHGYNYGDDLKVSIVDPNFLGFGSTIGEARLKGTDFYPNEWNAGVILEGGGPGPAPMVRLSAKVEETGGNWPPAAPVYAPLGNMNVEDQETQRLANWDWDQNAKLPFADVNPNYQINEDIWAGVNDSKVVQGTKFQHQPVNQQQQRVKDGCPIA